VPPILHSTIEPGAFHGVESDFSIVLLRTSEVDLMMCTVDIASPEDSMSLSTKSIHILRELTIEYNLPFPGILGFSSIREVDTK
jgi:hypothetical protein